MTDALVSWLWEQIAEDERVIRAAARNGDTWAALVDPYPNGFSVELFAAHLDSPRRCDEHPPGIPNLCDDNRLAAADDDMCADGDALITHVARTGTAPGTTRRGTWTDSRDAPSGEDEHPVEREEASVVVDEDTLRVAVDELVLAGIRAMHAIPSGEVRDGCVVQDDQAVKERLRKAVLGLIELSPVRSGTQSSDLPPEVLSRVPQDPDELV